MIALAIDLGTTACKASVIAADGSVLGSGLRRLATSFGHDGSAEQDAEDVWQATLAASRDALAAAGSSAGGLGVVCVAGQWSSVVPVDRSGRPVGPLRMWFDRRGERYTATLTDGDEGEWAQRWRDIHGFLPSTSLGHVLGFHDERDVHDRTAAYLEPVDYLNARLCGRIAATANSAMPFALTDNRTLGHVTWAPELIDRAGVALDRLPPIVPSMTVLGTVLPEVAGELGIDAGTVVATGANDSIASAFGSGSLGPGQGTIMMGTTGVLVVHHATRHVDTSKFLVTMPSALDDRYYVVAEGGLGGKLIELALTQVVGDADDDPPDVAFDALMAAAATSSPGAGGVLFLPWVFGSLSPAPDPRHRGALLGLSMATTRGDVARAMLEGISMQMRWLADEVEAATGVAFGAIRFVGGGAQSDVWAQILADVVGRPIEQVAHPRHANARGAGLMGFVAVGELTLDDVVANVPIRAGYEPEASTRSLYDERFAVVRDLHDRLGEPVSRLSHLLPHNDWSTS